MQNRGIILTVWICSRLERTEPVTDHKGSCAKAAKGTVYETWPGQKGAGTIQEETPDEDCFVAPVS